MPPGSGGEVEGWLSDVAAEATRVLLLYQHARQLVGDVAEIGVYDGKYFLVLIGGLADLEWGLAIDIFETQAPKIDSVQGSEARFRENLQKYAPQARVNVMVSDSTALTPADLQAGVLTADPRPFRFISIDGGHDAETCYSDLVLADSVLMDGGVIALDDWAPEGNRQWPGVGEAEVRFQTEHPDRLFHIGSIPNKLLTNHPFWQRDYQAVLRDFAKGLE